MKAACNGGAGNAAVIRLLLNYPGTLVNAQDKVQTDATALVHKKLSTKHLVFCVARIASLLRKCKYRI
jgi:hypothetical protein